MCALDGSNDLGGGRIARLIRVWQNYTADGTVRRRK
jgi:hypothetical protein